MFCVLCCRGSDKILEENAEFDHAGYVKDLIGSVKPRPSEVRGT
jgi:hypothetical protein